MMVDLHCHILYQTDDGPSSIEESIRMIEKAVEAGFTDLVLTPHYFPNGPYLKTAQENREKFEILRLVSQRAGLPVNLYLGNEVMNAFKVPALFEEGTVLPLGQTHYALIETGRKGTSEEALLTTIKKLDQAGLTAIFAHPERIDFVKEDPQTLKNFMRRGCLVQMNYLSLIGYYGEDVRRTAEELLRNGVVQLIGSDAHQADAYEWWAQAREEGSRILGEEKFLRILENGRKVIQGEAVLSRPGSPKATVSAFCPSDSLKGVFFD